ncbi:hypothetical protein RFI_29479 [Reticulomyxa filosa]|uniref:Uncharacterized protein n=1 Tax=Reticulomyxa filosa TaxID=46433 RepID=X6M2U7_RETFI|nr:hypothetical protein RFI_29479 [Reticulomyxa filosa]|eukprot:ETO07911.1 hypothetical protein RFI_29479 [Reticulomyxa filosa]
MEALLESLNELTLRLVYEQNPTTLDETELALKKVQNRFENEIQAKNKTYKTYKFEQTKRITNNKKFDWQKRNNPNTLYRTNCFTVNRKWSGKYSNMRKTNLAIVLATRTKQYDEHKGNKRKLNDECWS